MARVSNVQLRMENADLFSVNVSVDFTIDFTAEEVTARDQFRAQVELWGDDAGESPAGAPLLIGPLYRFSFGTLLRPRDYLVITAASAPVTHTVRAVISRSSLDEDPGFDTVIHHRGFNPERPAEAPDIVIKVPRSDEVYALITMTPARMTTARSDSQTIPEFFPFP